MDIEKINAEILDFQNKIRKLPKALKDYAAFNDLKTKIDDFNETCSLLEMMANNAMKERHWQRIEEVNLEIFLTHREDIEVSLLITVT